VDDMSTLRSTATPRSSQAARTASAAIAPGWIRTPMSAAELDAYGDVVFNSLHTVGKTQDIGLAVAWLCDPRNRFATGTVIPVDGGQTAILPVPWRP
jgi:NAD(P)-dependent dehydrogenase (short-subunit alcohol dehydrogenase family)